MEDTKMSLDELSLEELLSACLEFEKEVLLNSYNNDQSLIITRSIHSLNRVRVASDKRLAIISNLIDFLESEINYVPYYFLRLIAFNWIILKKKTISRRMLITGVKQRTIKVQLSEELSFILLNQYSFSKDMIKEEIYKLIAESQLTY